MMTPSTGAPIAHAFDPSDWLSRFEQTGGGYALTDRLTLVILVEDQPEQNIIGARLMINALTEADRGAIAAYLRGRA